jgi:hypothetical protein
MVLSAGVALGASVAQYSWQEPQAEVLPIGDLRWQPRPFVFQTGPTVHYIDYEKGDDSNAGDSTARPWKHHPWDAHATGLAKADAGRDTYVFKRGVTYRGRLVPAVTGTAEAPIMLTSDPSWGEGEAVLAGSEQVTGWSRGGHPAMPDADKVWHADLDFLPRAAWLTTSGAIQRLALARTPNWEIESLDDIHSQWAVWKRVEQVERDGETMNRAEDPELLGRFTPQQLAGAMVWTEYASFMGTAYPTLVLFNEATPQSIDFKHWVSTATKTQTKPNDRYFLEDRPAFLDAPGEFWFERKGDGGRLYVRLPGDLDPSTTQVEAARYLSLIDAKELRHIRIRGLTFRFTNVQWDITEYNPLGNDDVDPAAIRLQGSGNDIAIDHCKFEHVTRAVRLRAAPDDGGSIDNVSITDNDVHDTDHGAFWITDGVRWVKIDQPYGKVGRVEVLRNRAEQIGFRPHPRSHGNAIQIDFAAITEVAGNILDRIHGAGLFFFGGIGDGQTRDGPLSRHLIYQNRVNRPLLGTNDWGGIETWQAGPFYVYNNVSIAPGGYWHARSLKRHAEPGPYTYMDSRFGFAYYLDGSSKNYLFNNIGLGSNNDPASPLCNTGALHEIIGQDNLFFNNSFARFAAAVVSYTRTSVNSAFLGNVFEDMSLAGWYFSAPKKLVTSYDSQFSRLMERHRGELALDNNLLSGQPPATVGTTPWNHQDRVEMSDFRAALTHFSKVDVPVGEIVPRRLLPRYSEGDFRLADDSAVAGRGAKVFVPWGLYGCVAEWNFHSRGDNPSVVIDEHCYFTWGYLDRMKYSDLPRHDLQGVNISRTDFVAGPLEDWTADTLRLDGTTQYLVLPDAGLFRPTHVERTSYQRPGAPVTYDRTHWRTPDVGTGSFLIEAYLRPAPGRGGLLLAKHDGRTGYALDLDAAGHPRLRLEQAGQLVAQRVASMKISDDAWHHLVVEINRARPDGITIWIDGLRDEGTLTGKVTESDLDNPGDVLVGGGSGKAFFRGDLAFLRLCLGTFADSRTTIDELRAWEFAGPQLADFTGRVAAGKRDAGALLRTPAPSHP